MVDLLEFLIGVTVVDVTEVHAEELLARVAVMAHGRFVDGQDGMAVAVIDDHRHRIAFKQQAEGFLTLLEFGDVNAQTDDAAVGRAAFLDQDAAAVGKMLLVGLAWVEQLGNTLLDPFLFMTDGFGIIAALDADAQRVRQFDARFEQVRGTFVDVRVFLVPENVAAFRVEKDEAMRKNVDGFTQPRMGLLGLRRRRLRFRAHADQRGVG